jgi:uncharacterized protein (DUF169 family)
MSKASELRQRAERFLRMLRLIGDPAAVNAIYEEAGKLNMTAEEMERRHDIRECAHEIWIEHGRPEGRDIEFWLAAEREVDRRRRR